MMNPEAVYYLILLLAGFAGTTRHNRVKVKAPWLPKDVVVYQATKEEPSCRVFIKLDVVNANGGENVMLDSLTVKSFDRDSVWSEQTLALSHEDNTQGFWIPNVSTRGRLVVSPKASGYEIPGRTAQQLRVYQPRKYTKDRVAFMHSWHEAFSDSLSWTAIIQDASTGLPLRDVEVRVVDIHADWKTLRSTKTDAYGQASLNMKRWKPNQLAINHEGYRPLYTGITPGLEIEELREFMRLVPEVEFPFIPFDEVSMVLKNDDRCSGADSLTMAMELLSTLKNGTLGVKGFSSDSSGAKAKAMAEVVIESLSKGMDPSMTLRRTKYMPNPTRNLAIEGHSGVEIFVIDFDGSASDTN